MMAGCSSRNDLDALFNDNDELTSVRQNNHTVYFDYYLPSDLEEVNVNRVAGVFSYQNSTIIMNLNVPSIVNSRYYADAILNDDGFFEEDRLTYHNEGTFKDIDGQMQQYIFNVYAYDDCYILHLLCLNVNIYGYSSKNELYDLAKKMLLLARNTTVRYDEVIAKYSSKEVIDYERKQLDLFSYNLPSSGIIDELLIGEETSNEETNDEE